MKDKGSQAGWGFWLGWVVASSVGWIVGAILGFGLGLIIIGDDYGINVLRIIIGYFLVGATLGFGVSIMQWLVLRRRVSRAGWWVLASTAGFAVAVGGEGGLQLGSSVERVAVLALGGAVTGILQWLVLRGKVSRACWWVLASTVGWALSIAVREVLTDPGGGWNNGQSHARGSAGSGYGRSLSLAIATTRTRSLVGV
jgi:hypothetical protein